MFDRGQNSLPVLALFVLLSNRVKRAKLVRLLSLHVVVEPFELFDETLCRGDTPDEALASNNSGDRPTVVFRSLSSVKQKKKK